MPSLGGLTFHTQTRHLLNKNPLTPVGEDCRGGSEANLLIWKILYLLPFVTEVSITGSDSYMPREPGVKSDHFWHRKYSIGRLCSPDWVWLTHLRMSATRVGTWGSLLHLPARKLPSDLRTTTCDSEEATLFPCHSPSDSKAQVLQTWALGPTTVPPHLPDSNTLSTLLGKLFLFQPPATANCQAPISWNTGENQPFLGPQGFFFLQGSVSSLNSIAGLTTNILEAKILKVKVKVLVTPSGPTLCDPMDCITHQAPLSMGFPRQEYWSAISFSRGSSWPRNWTHISCIAGRFFTSWATREDITETSGGLDPSSEVRSGILYF